MAELKFSGSRIFKNNYQARTRFIVNQGGTRSTKTYTILQVLLTKFAQAQDLVITIARKSFPSLRGSVMRDFFDILRSSGCYNSQWHNRTSNEYYNPYQNNLVEFVSADQADKIKGRKRDYLFLNEALEFTKDEVMQFLLRTSGQIFIDFNPSEQRDWLTAIMAREDATVIRSTFLDNEFLSNELKHEIEGLKDIDPWYWKVYGQGEYAVPTNVIYTNWEVIKRGDWPDPEAAREIIYGIDFGYTHPSVLAEVSLHDDEVYIRELLYERELTNNDFIERAKELTIRRSSEYFADSASPDKIEEWYRAGFNIHPAEKSVPDGLDLCKRKRLYVHQDSVNAIKELKGYKWKEDRAGNILRDEPVKMNDDFLDAMRYALFTYYKKYMDGDYREPASRNIKLEDGLNGYWDTDLAGYDQFIN